MALRRLPLISWHPCESNLHDSQAGPSAVERIQAAVKEADTASRPQADAQVTIMPLLTSRLYFLNCNALRFEDLGHALRRQVPQRQSAQLSALCSAASSSDQGIRHDLGLYIASTSL